MSETRELTYQELMIMAEAALTQAEAAVSKFEHVKLEFSKEQFSVEDELTGVTATVNGLGKVVKLEYPTDEETQDEHGNPNRRLYENIAVGTRDTFNTALHEAGEAFGEAVRSAFPKFTPERQ